MGRAKRRTAGFLVGALVLTGAACSDEPTKPSELSDEPSTSGQSSSPAPSSSVSADEQAIIDAYKGYFNTLSALGGATDAEAQDALAPYAEPGLIGAVVAVLQKYRAEGKKPGGHVTFGDIQVTMTGNSATISECRDGSSESLVDADTGAVLSVGGPGQKFEATAHKSSGQWLLSGSKGTKNGC